MRQSVYLPDIRTAAMRRRYQMANGMHHATACELCLKPLTAPPVMLAIDHERYEAVSEIAVSERGDAVSLYPFGADCARRVRRALRAE